jgi:hypothetical protein
MRSKSVAVLGLCLLAAGCATNWEPQYGPPSQAASANQGGRARLMMKDGSRIDLEFMRLEGDSIIGSMGEPPERVAVAADDVQLVLVPHTDTSSPIKTAIITVGGVLIALIIASVLVLEDLFDEI